ncbi:APC family permease [Actinotalea sp.]|uniref:APC family permease n=1 Tax=Actinotalea sp. TaxID=1872145 RepID=UPI0035661C41
MTSEDYRKGSLSLAGTVAMGTGVMIGAGIFALTGQVAGLAGAWFPLAFVLAGLVSGLSAYSYIKVSSAYPSAGGIAMILSKAYGRTAVAATASMIMAFSMVINESLVARTFGTYVVQLLDVDDAFWVPVLAVGLILAAFGVNVAGNKAIGAVSKVAAVLKVGGILAFAVVTLWVAGFDFQPVPSGGAIDASVSGLLAGTALAVLAYKGFTTITNSGSEVVDPGRNIGRAIVISLAVCAVVYLAVAVAVGSALTIPEIVQARDYSLAEAARPALGGTGVVFTVVIAIIATASGLLASTFAVSRMLAMLTDMKLIPHRHFGMPGRVQQHTLVYTVVVAAVMAALFDLSRIAAVGAILYLVMDMAIHWGVLRHLRNEVGARPGVLIAAIVADTIILGAFVAIRARQDPFIVVLATAMIVAVFAFEAFYLGAHRRESDAHEQ